MSGVLLACLPDEDLDPGLVNLLDAAGLGWRVTSVRAEGWLGVKNGPLLEAMAVSRLTQLGGREVHEDDPCTAAPVLN